MALWPRCAVIRTSELLNKNPAALPIIGSVNCRMSPELVLTLTTRLNSGFLGPLTRD
jgi:hypothetical protein